MKNIQRLFPCFLLAVGAVLFAFPSPVLALEEWERLSFDRILGLVTKGAHTLIKYGGLAAIGFLVVGGIQYMTSAGDKQALEIAKKTITYALVGSFLILGAYLIVTTICGQLGVDCGI